MTADRTVVVTGAAGSIGAATVVRFLERGLTVLGIDRDDARPAGARHHHVVVDLADADALQAGLDGALGRLPRVAHVVGIAGGALPEEPSMQDDIASMDPAVFRASLDANLVTQFILMRSIVRHLGQRSDEDRSICFTSSFNALSAQGMPAYSAAKAGIIGMMHASVRPLGRLRIRVNVVAPGTVRTPRTERLWAAVPDHFARLEAGSALGRLAQPDDVAAAFAALALDLHHVTGQVLVVDGGQSAAHA